MVKITFKKILIYLFLVIIIFSLDRISKLYVLNLAETNNLVNVYLTSFLNVYLIWNNGVAFGLLPFEKTLFYNLITFLLYWPNKEHA